MDNNSTTKFNLIQLTLMVVAPMNILFSRTVLFPLIDSLDHLFSSSFAFLFCFLFFSLSKRAATGRRREIERGRERGDIMNEGRQAGRGGEGINNRPMIKREKAGVGKRIERKI